MSETVIYARSTRKSESDKVIKIIEEIDFEETLQDELGEAGQAELKEKEKYPYPYPEKQTESDLDNCPEILEAIEELKGEYKAFMKKCMKEGKSLKACATEWKSKKKGKEEEAKKDEDEDKEKAKEEQARQPSEGYEVEAKKKKYPYPKEMSAEQLDDKVAELLSEAANLLRKKKEPEEELKKKKDEDEPKEMAKNFMRRVNELQKENKRLVEKLSKLENKGWKKVRQPEELSAKTGVKREYEIGKDGSIRSWD